MPEDRTVGARLRRARDERGLSLRQIADATKLSIRSLEALERDQVAQLPSGIYRRAIVRAFATEVGLDPEATLRAFLIDHPDDLPPPPGAPRAVEPASTERPAQASRGLFRIFGAFVPIVAGIVYFGLDARPRVTQLSVRDLTDVSHGAGDWRPEIVPAGGFAEAPPRAARPVSLMITVTDRCRLRVVADGREVSAGIMEPGGSLDVDLGRDVVLSGDDAGAVQFSINGQAGRLLGSSGEPLDIRITRDDYSTFLLPH